MVDLGAWFAEERGIAGDPADAFDEEADSTPKRL